MRFRLSGRQRKEIEVRATGLLVALPVPIHPVDDELAYCRSRLDVPPEWVRSVQPGEVDVDPVTPAGAAAVLPSIVAAGLVADETLTLRVRVYVALVAAADRRRRTSGKVEWPGGEIER